MLKFFVVGEAWFISIMVSVTHVFKGLEDDEVEILMVTLILSRTMVQIYTSSIWRKHLHY